MRGKYGEDVQAIIESVSNEQRRTDAVAIVELMTEITGEPPKAWGESTIGFGRYHYRYKTGQEGDFFVVGLAPRKDRLTLYIMSGLRGFDDILDRLGPHQASKSTVHVKRLDDLDREALTQLISECAKHVATVEREMGAIPRMSDIPPRQT